MKTRSLPAGMYEKMAVLILECCENKEIAQRLGLAQRTIKHYRNLMYKQHNITTGVKAVKLAVLLYRQQYAGK